MWFIQEPSAWIKDLPILRATHLVTSVLCFRIHHPADKQNAARIVVADEEQEWMVGLKDRLFVDFTGTTVSKGDHMVELYSPELISAQAELLQALKTADNVKTATSELVKRITLATLEAAREKLRLLGLTNEQISKIESSGKKPLTHITIYSPIGGIVIHKNATEGLYVETGMPIYTIADLSQLWVRLDAYESDLPWIRYGQEAEFTTEAYPGEAFKGKINFIEPVLNEKTRTVKLRVNVDGGDGKTGWAIWGVQIVRHFWYNPVFERDN